MRDKTRWLAHGGGETGGRVTLYSRRGKNFNAQFGYVAQELEYLPDETVIDGEMVAVNEEGRPSFDLLQNFRSEQSNVIYYAFDIPIHNGNDLMQRPLSERREVLRSVIRAASWSEPSGRIDAVDACTPAVAHLPAPAMGAAIRTMFRRIFVTSRDVGPR